MQIEILSFGVTTTEDERAQFPAMLLPESRVELLEDAIPVLWYRVYGTPTTTVQVLEIRDSSDVVVWTATISPDKVDAAAMAYIARSTSWLPQDFQPVPLPPGRYTARLLLPEFSGTEASTIFLVSN